jgi:CubicO group peptidase (beta-lactamase class C family)
LSYPGVRADVYLPVAGVRITFNYLTAIDMDYSRLQTAIETGTDPGEFNPLAMAIALARLYPLLELETAYAAKTVCSGTFISGRTSESVSFLGLTNRTAIHRPGFACTLVLGFPQEGIRAQPLPAIAEVPAPSGTAPTTDVACELALLPDGWVEYLTTPTPSSGGGVYGAHVWLGFPEDTVAAPESPIPDDAYYMLGHEGQMVAIVPSKDLVVVRLGLSRYPETWNHRKFLESVISTLEPVESE